MAMVVGYARVSTKDQILDGQIEELKAAGATIIYREKISGVRADPPPASKADGEFAGGRRRHCREA
jgi:hypothetical protein